MRYLKNFVLMLLLMSVVPGCSYDYEEMLEKFEPKEESKFAKAYLEEFRNRNFEEVKKHMSNELLTPDLDAKLHEVADYFPEGTPLEVDTVGVNVINFRGKRSTNITYQYHFPNGWALVGVALHTECGRISVKGVHVNRLPRSLKETNAFSFKGKTVTHYLFLILAFGIPLFSIFSLVLCILTPMKKRKWLWILFILIGTEGFFLDWTTGQLAFKFLHIQLLGAGAGKAGPYAPWIITLSSAGCNPLSREAQIAQARYWGV